MSAPLDKKTSSLNKLFENITLGCEVSQILEGARTYHNHTLDELKRFHNRIEKLEDSYKENPSLFKERHFQKI